MESINWILEEQIKHSYFLPDTTVQLEKVCPTFKVAIHFHPDHQQLKTLTASSNALVERVLTKVDYFFQVSIDGVTFDFSMYSVTNNSCSCICLILSRKINYRISVLINNWKQQVCIILLSIRLLGLNFRQRKQIRRRWKPPIVLGLDLQVILSYQVNSFESKIYLIYHCRFQPFPPEFRPKSKVKTEEKKD